MANKNPNMNIPEDSGMDIGDVIASNLRRLIAQNKMTQKEFAEKLDIPASSISDYCNNNHLPSVQFLVQLKNLYNISIDDFLTKSINPVTGKAMNTNYLMDPDVLATYRKYCGIYFVYYLDTGRYKGRDTQLPKDSVTFGILYIYENPTSLSVPEFSCAAVLGLESREESAYVKRTLETRGDAEKIIEYIDAKYPGTVYHGDLEMSPDHVFVTMKHANTDKALLIIHRVDNNKRDYIGGIGTVNSISKGRERAPVVQFMGISRYSLSMSVEEIHHNLLLNYPIFSAENEAEELIKSFKALYIDDNETSTGISDYQKSIVIRSTLERYIRKSLESNMFRYGKISERDDDDWYQAIKNSSDRTD